MRRWGWTYRKSSTWLVSETVHIKLACTHLATQEGSTSSSCFLQPTSILRAMISPLAPTLTPLISPNRRKKSRLSLRQKLRARTVRFATKMPDILLRTKLKPSLSKTKFRLHTLRCSKSGVAATIRYARRRTLATPSCPSRSRS